MIFDCGPTELDLNLVRLSKIQQWHPVFAWYPVSVGKTKCAWLQRVEQRYPHAWVSSVTGDLWYSTPEYRLPT